MPNLLEKTPEAPFPSELNPLTNPILEQNLGRWAKVYFNNPPAKREQAVNNLLEEIKRESGAGAPRPPTRSSLFCNGPKIPARGLLRLPTSESTRSQILQPVRPSPWSGTATFDGKSGCCPEFPKPFRQAPTTIASWLSDQTFTAWAIRIAPRSGDGNIWQAQPCIVLAGFAYVQWVPGPPDKSCFARQPAADECSGNVVPAGNLFAVRIKSSQQKRLHRNPRRIGGSQSVAPNCRSESITSESK